MDAQHDGIADEDARALWRRAAELQRSAQDREERDDRPLLEPERGTRTADEVLGAAREAGISGEHLLVAWAERRLVDADEIEADRWSSRWLRALLGGDDAVELDRRVDAPPDRVRDAVAEVVSSDAFRMRLEDRLGDPEEGAEVLVYRSDPPRPSFWAPAFHTTLDLADGRVVVVALRPEGEGTRLRLRAPLYRRGLNLALTGGSAGVLGAGGGVGGVAAGEAVAALIGASSVVPLAAPAVVGAVAGGGLGVWAFRKVYRWGRRKGERALERLGRAVVAEASKEEG